MQNRTQSSAVFLLLLVLLSLFLSTPGCKQNRMPELTIPVQSVIPQDSSLSLLLIGKYRQETLPVPNKKIGKNFIVRPDTSIYKHALFYTDGGSKLSGYLLRNGFWQNIAADSIRLLLEKDVPSASDLPDASSRNNIVPFLSGKDVYGKDVSLSQLYYKHPVALIFTGIQTLTASDSLFLRSTIDSVQADSVIPVYLVLTPSNQEARQYINRDSAKCVIFSDSLGVVSRARKKYGIKTSSALVLIDTLGYLIQ